MSRQDLSSLALLRAGHEAEQEVNRLLQGLPQDVLPPSRPVQLPLLGGAGALSVPLSLLLHNVKMSDYTEISTSFHFSSHTSNNKYNCTILHPCKIKINVFFVLAFWFLSSFIIKWRSYFSFDNFNVKWNTRLCDDIFQYRCRVVSWYHNTIQFFSLNSLSSADIELALLLSPSRIPGNLSRISKESFPWQDQILIIQYLSYLFIIYSISHHVHEEYD